MGEDAPVHAAVEPCGRPQPARSAPCKVRTGPPRTSDGRWADCITFHSTSRCVRLTGADLRAQ
eukprot:7384058-Prymnesium_polylepis.1